MNKKILIKIIELLEEVAQQQATREMSGGIWWESFYEDTTSLRNKLKRRRKAVAQSSPNKPKAGSLTKGN